MLRHLQTIHAQAADLNNDFKFKIVAAVYLRNKPIAYGYCHLKSHTFQARYGRNDESIFWHAETYAIHNSLKRIDKSVLTKCTLYIARSKDRGEFGMAKPCCGCLKCIEDYNLKSVIYTLDDPTNSKYGIINCERNTL